MFDESKNDKIIFGQYPFRGTMQAVRLLCQYIGVQYQNKFFNPVQWETYKENEAKDWLYQKIPFMKCGDLILTNSLAAAQYIVQKYNRTDLFGITQKERIVVSSSVSFQNITADALALECDMKKHKLTDDEKKMKRQNYWRQKFQPKFKKAEQMIHGPWFFNHITWIDFFIYEDYLLFSIIYPEMKNFKKLKGIFENVAELPAVKNYQNSSGAIKSICPNKYFCQFVQNYKKMCSSNKSQKPKSSCFNLCSKQGNDKKPIGFNRYKKDQSQMDIQ